MVCGEQGEMHVKVTGKWEETGTRPMGVTASEGMCHSTPVTLQD